MKAKKPSPKVNTRAVQILDGVALTAFLVGMTAFAVGVVAHETHYAPRCFASGIGAAMIAMFIQPFFTGVIRLKGGRTYTRRQDPRKFYWVAGPVLVTGVLIVGMAVLLMFLP